MRRSRAFRYGALMLTTALLGGLGACESAAPREPRRGPVERPGIADEPTSQDQAARMAAEDAEALRLKGGTTQPAARRPPRQERRQAVDQPRIRR